MTEASLAGTTHRVRWAPAGGVVGDCDELAAGRDAGRWTRKRFLETDHGRAAAVTGPRTAGLIYETFVGDRWTAELEVVAGPGGPRVKVRLNYFWLEGCVVGVGLSSRDGATAHAATSFDDEDLAAARFWQYIAAIRLLHAWGVAPRLWSPEGK